MSLAQQLLLDSRLAKLSGLCYIPDSNLSEALSHYNLRLVAHGKASFTTWYVAQDDRKQRYYFCRGVSWRHIADDYASAAQLWMNLSRAFPTPFLPDCTVPKNTLEVHSGVGGMVDELWEAMSPYLAEDSHMVFSGHSLGGSLALLLGLKCRLKLGIDPEQIECVTFGSLPVLSTNRQDGNVVKAASMKRIRNYVLDNDPVPRTLLSVDPTFVAFKNSLPAIKSILEWRQQVYGKNAMFSLEKFMYQPAGPLFLIKWNAEQGQRVTLVEDVETELALPYATPRNPIQFARAMMDHHHGSYAQELHAAGAALLNATK